MAKPGSEVIIIGAGITGIGAGYYLRANNISYTILEAKDDLGGVWNTHRWHGARCDSDFIKYSFSFKPFLSAQCLQSSGTTAICCAPELSRVSKSLVLLQRSPSYIYEIANRAGPLIVLCQCLYRLGIRFPVKWLRHYLQLRDDAIFVGFRRFPRLARWFFRHHWLKAVGRDAFREHFSPRYNPWEQRVAVAIGLKEKLRTGEIAIRTGEIDRFTQSAIVLGSGESIECDACILATGLNLRFFNFDIYVAGARVGVERINFYKGLMVGGIPNYFHPMGTWHTAWTQRSEPLTRFAIRIMAHMKAQGFGTVSVERREIDSAPGITPNYVMRRLSIVPRLHGTWNLPSIDNLFANRFDPGSFNFS